MKKRKCWWSPTYRVSPNALNWFRRPGRAGFEAFSHQRAHRGGSIAQAPQLRVEQHDLGGRLDDRGEARRRFTVADHEKATTGVESRKDEDVIDETPMAYKSARPLMSFTATTRTAGMIIAANIPRFGTPYLFNF